jgi:hypothetical protein
MGIARGPAGRIIEASVKPSEPQPQPVQRGEEEPMLYCPRCSSRLAARKCKLICEKCGYYMSCADYY